MMCLAEEMATRPTAPTQFNKKNAAMSESPFRPVIL
ncbi:hypothetical protein SLEP1_g52187 [Rubroshorea leprosula]|uniref:Uncharacterized protein n=1 Tax=Rubroshorea leprosula TaxID=152421 RepID=A0AAV5M6J1_9ROSI|nr:hypothetical protein SLEP1_g52187 [Rubroshorea leprosula]